MGQVLRRGRRDGMHLGVLDRLVDRGARMFDVIAPDVRLVLLVQAVSEEYLDLLFGVNATAPLRALWQVRDILLRVWCAF